MSGPRGIDFYYGDGTPSLAGQTFDVIKASEGAGFPPDGPIPAWYAAEQAKIRAAGAVFGAYHFWHPGVDNAAQLANFLRRANLRDGDVIQLDCEVTDGLDWATVNARKNDMLGRLKAARPRNRVLLYTYLDFWNHIDANAGDGLWIADPSAPAGAPRVAHWVIHQYGSDSVDYDIANFPDAAALRAWASGLIPKASTQEGTMPLLLDVQPDPANPTVNQGVWYQDGALLFHVINPGQLGFFQSVPNVREGKIEFAQFQEIRSRVAALGGSATVQVTVDTSQLTSAVVAALSNAGLLAAEGAAIAHAEAVQEHNDTPPV